MAAWFPDESRILVPGVSSGIGRSATLLLNAEGRAVGLLRNARRPQALNQAAVAPERIFTEQRDLTVESQGLRFNCVSPTLVDTPMVSEPAREYTAGRYPLGWGQPEDVAYMIAFLLSSRSRAITGENYLMDGGGVL